MTSEIADRLRAHAAAIVAGAGVPEPARSDLEEELYGHLVERWRAHMADGLGTTEAGNRAIEDFGSRADLGREFGRTYHSRLWASTIGVLLPAIAPAEARPPVIGWLRFVVGLTIVATAIWVLALPAMTPLRALGSGVALAIGLTGLVLAFQALGRGQRWALLYAVGVTVLLLIVDLAGVIVPERPPASVTIPLGAILAAGVLLAVLQNWERLQAFVASSTRLSRGLAVLLAIALLGPAAVPRVLAAIPDPTQATAADLALLLSLTCDRGDVPQQGGPTLVDTQRATLVIDTTWSRTDLLPHGMVGVVTRPDDADTSGFRVIAPAPWSWVWAGAPTIVETTTGARAGWWGSSSPSVALLPQANMAGSDTVAIDPQAIRPNHTIRTTWVLVGETHWPRIEVMYAHLDRFVVAGTVGCGETVQGRPIPLPVEEPQATDSFPL